MLALFGVAAELLATGPCVITKMAFTEDQEGVQGADFPLKQ